VEGVGVTNDERTAPREVFGRDYFTIAADSCALLVMDMQNSFVAEAAVFEVPAARKIIPNIERLVESARTRPIPIIWTQSDNTPPAGGLILDRYPIIRQTRELWKGDKSFELYPHMIQPLGNEHRVVKHKYDAFHDTDLDTILRNLHRDTIILTGVATEVCCESTARAAFFHEYRVVFLSDATAAIDPDVHRSTCDRIDLLFGRVLDTDEVLSIIEAGGEH
jgi:nicotinamidase-related amidase